MDPTVMLQRHALEGVKTAKIEYIHKIHSNDPTMNKTGLKYAVGLGISTKVISEYWKTYVDPTPIYQIKPIEE